MDLYGLACLAVLAAGLIALAVIDLKTGYLPFAIQIPLAIAGLGIAVYSSPVGVGWREALIGAAVGGAVFAGLRWIVTRLKGREAMGLGDVWLVMVGGLWLGPFALPYIMAAGGLLTIVGAGIAAAVTGKPILKGEMPLGPGLAAGILGVFMAALAKASWLMLSLTPVQGP